MLKVTKMNQNENGERTFLMKDTEAPQQKISIVGEVVTIEAKGEKTKTLKAPRTTKKYMEVISLYLAKKGLDQEQAPQEQASKENGEEVGTIAPTNQEENLNATEGTTEATEGKDNDGQSVTPINTTEATTEDEKHQESDEKNIISLEASHVEIIEPNQEEKTPSNQEEETQKNNDGEGVDAPHVEILESMESITVNQEQAHQEDEKHQESDEKNLGALNIQELLKEKENNYLLDIIINEKEEEYKNLNFHISNIDIVIDDTCKAMKIVTPNGGERFTNFYLYVASDNQELNTKLREAMQVVMMNYLNFMKQENFEMGKAFFKGDTAKYNTFNGIILKNGANINIPYFIDESIKEYKEFSMDKQEIILRIPYQNNVGEIRKYVHIAYFLAKKQIKNFYSAMKKIKLAQQKEANKKAQ